MKKPQRSSFKLNPVAAAIAMALASQFPANVAQAGSGFGIGSPQVVMPTYYANSPAGPAPQLIAGVPTMRVDGSNLPVMVDSGKALRKFVDTLPVIPSAVPEKWVDLNGVTTADDYYEIAAVEFTQQMHSDLKKATHLRGYVQLMTPGLLAKGVVAKSFTTYDGQVLSVVDNPHHLGPIINSTKGTAVRVKFTNLLPTGAGGQLFVPVDTTITGAGNGPDGTPYTQNRAEIHLVGGESPWISAGTPHQWVAPAAENTTHKKGDSQQNVPDMADPGAGSTTLFFPNDLSARFTFYQDRTSGLTRLNSYVGLEAGYSITDDAEKALIAGGALTHITGYDALGVPTIATLNVAAGTIPGAADTIPLIIEDKTFVPANVDQQDALWNKDALGVATGWGAPGDLWFPHVYEPNQDPTQANGANPVGRWDYGPLFWPIFPSLRGALPSTSFTPEAYMDTPVINGTAYPTLTVDAKAYRLRILNASNDRYINLGLYKADGTVQAPQLDEHGNPVVDKAGNQQFFTNTEVKMVPAAADALGNPANWDKVNNVQLPLPQFLDATGAPVLPWNINAEPSGPTRAWPTDGRAGGTPDPTTSGPDFIVIGNDGGLLPHAVDIPSQPVTYETNRRSITVLNIYGYGLLLGPAERADTIVDFSKYAGQTLILFNDAPAPTPFNDPRNDYYTGDPDQTGQGGAYSTLPGYGPNTRTMMQIKVNAGVNGTATPAAPFNATALRDALPVAYASSNPPIVPAVAYNQAFGTNDTDVFGHVASGSIAQPNLDYTTTGQLTIQSLSLITSGGTAGPGGVVAGNAVPGSGSGYVTAPLVVISDAAGNTSATATATVDNVPTLANKGVPTFQVTGLVLNSPGAGYTSAPTVTFVPQPALTSVTLNTAGSGYTAPKVTISAPNVAGGTQATATATIATSSSIVPIVKVTNAGSGYAAPIVSFTGGAPVAGATAAAGYATISSSPLSTTTSVSLGGAGYTAPKAVFSTNTGNPGTGAVASVSISQSVSVALAGGVAITGFPAQGTLVTISGPNALSGPLAQATADPIFDVGTGAITGFTMTNPGSGYTTAPTVTITDTVTQVTNTTGATGSLAAGTGVITGVTITNVGKGYTQAPTISFTDATGSGALATATLATTAGTVTGITITNTGSGYTSAPSIVLTDAGVVNASAVVPVVLSNAVGAISAIKITDPGTGYTSTPTITIADSNGGTGSGASATAGMTTSGVGAQASVLTSRTKSIPVQTKAEQELFDDFGRYNSTGGVEIPLTNGVIQTTVPLNYIDSATEILSDITLNNNDVQIWKLVDNGFWSNSVHFDMVDVQLINRVGWDGTVKAPATNEVGWKDTVRLNPLEDVIIAMRAKRPTIPFGQPQSSRLLDPSKPVGTTGLAASGMGFTGALAVGVVPAVAAANETRVFDNEFTWGSAILGHSSNDFTRPVIFNPTVIIPAAPGNLADATGTAVLTWTDPTPTSTPLTTLANTQNEIGFKVLKAPVTNGAVSGAFARVVDPVTNLPVSIPANVTSWTEPGPIVLPFTPVAYEVVAYNVAGDSIASNVVIEAAPIAPTCAGATTAFLTPATTTADVAVTLNCTDNSNNEQIFNVSRSGGAGPVVNTTVPAITLAAPSALTIPDSPVVENTTYTYSVTATNVFGTSTPAATVTLTTPVSVPLAPTNVAYTLVAEPCPTGIQAACKPANVSLTWTDAAFNEVSYVITRTGGVAFAPVTVSGNALNNTGTTLTYVDKTAAEAVAYTYTVTAVNASGSNAGLPLAVTLPVTAPTIPTGVTVVPSTAVDANGVYVDTALVSWTDNAFNETGYTVSRAVTAPANLVAPAVVVGIVSANTSNNPMGIATAGWTAPNPTMSFTDSNLADGVTYAYTVAAVNSAALAGVPSATVTQQMPGIIINAPSNFVATPNRAGSSIGLSWTDNARNETDYMIEERVSTDNGLTYGPWTPLVGTPVASAPVPNGVGFMTFSRANVPTTLGLLYAFRVSARAVPSDSPYAYVQSNLQAPALPAAPALTGSLNTATRMVTLNWNAITPAAGTTISYIVNVNGVPVATNLTTYTYRATVAQLSGGIALNYTVQSVARAIRVAGQTVFGSSTSVASNQVTLQAGAPAAPATPTGLAATIAAATGAVTLNWAAVTPAAGTTITYMVSVNGGTPVAAVRGGAIALATGSSYQVQVEAVATTLGLSTASVLSTPITVDLTAAAVPVAPATLTVSATALNWAAATGVSTNATVAYMVQKSVDGGVTWTPVTGPTAARTFAIASPVGTNYQYQVAAQATRYGLPASALSAWKKTVFNTAPAATTPAPVATQGIVGSKAITVTWTNTSTNITGWTVTRRVAAGAWLPYTPTPALPLVGGSYSFTDAGLTAGTLYTYRVTATSLGGTTAVATSNAIAAR